MFAKNLAAETVKDAAREVPMDEVVKKQILAIRAAGEANMFDTYAVQYIANREGYYELVLFLQANRREYVDFILNGNRR